MKSLYNKGYTLLEILISTAIIMGIVGGGIAVYRNFNDRQLLINAGREFTLTLRNTQKRAQSGEKPTVCGSETLNGWQITAVDTTSYTIEAVCGSLTSVPETMELPIGITFQTPSYQFLFTVITGRIDNPQVISIVSEAGDIYNVQVTAGGGIIDQGVQADAG